MDPTNIVSKVSIDNEALVANEIPAAAPLVSELISAPKLAPTATFNDLPNEILAKIASYAITKPVLNYNENLQNFKLYDRPSKKPKRLPNTITDYETAHNLSQVSRRLQIHVSRACLERNRHMETTEMLIESDFLKPLSRGNFMEPMKNVEECKYVQAGLELNQWPRAWPREDPLNCKHCLAMCRYETVSTLMGDEVALVQKDAKKLLKVCEVMAERPYVTDNQRWQGFVIANKHRFVY